MARPILVYDGDCGFCRRWVERWKHLTRGRVDYAPSQEVAARFPQVAHEQFEKTVVLVEPDGTTCFGAEAVFRALAHARGGAIWPAAYRNVPGFAKLSEGAYALVARHRVVFSRATRLLWGSDVRSPDHALVRSAVLRGIGLVYLVAFLSLWVQIEGLVGSRGILPLAPWLNAVAQRTGSRPWTELPTLFWLGASDVSLHVVCAAGVAAASALLLGLLPGPAAAAAWVCYLSLFTAGRTFLSFQWDILLLESGVIACLWAPWSMRLRRGEPASRLPLWLTRWLVFRLMLLSGFVKLASHDPVWRDLTAMSYHYQTQPLPAWTSWYAHHLPMTFHRVETGAMFFIELVLPFLIFMPRRPRLLAFVGFLALQVMIGATGNYGFFNLLTAVLCLSLLDDAHLRSWAQRLRRGAGAGNGNAGGDIDVAGVDDVVDMADGVPAEASSSLARRGAQALVALAAAVLFVLSGGNLVGRIAGYDAVPQLVRRALEAADAWQLTSNYGLFAVMTKQRPEIIIEGSDDGEVWKPYEFRWKPGDTSARPRFVEPHMPRLDWQMWFAALGTYHRNPWLINFMERLLESSPPVLRLIAVDPFDGHAPRYVRALIYEYRFTGPGKGETGWWTRSAPRLYAPVMQQRGLGASAAAVP